MKKIWDFLNSLKLTVYLVLVVTAVTMYGSIVIYTRPEIYGDMDMHLFFPWLFTIGLKNAGSAWWFFLLVLLVVLLALNTFVCTIDRLPKIYAKFADPLTNLRELELGGDKGVEAALTGGPQGLKDTLGKSGYRVFEKDSLLFAEKNRWLPFVPYAVHVGVLLFMLAHFIGGVSGYRNTGVYVFEGETVKSPAGGFSLRLDRVRVDYRPDGSMKDYGSELTAIEDGKEIKKAFVGANRPMFVGGGAVYQREFGRTARGVYLSASVGSTGFRDYINIPRGAGPVMIPGTDYAVAVEDFIPDFGVDEAGRPYSRSQEMANPAVLVTLYKGGERRSTGWLLAQDPAQGNFTDPDVSLGLAELDVRAYSSFDINRDPSAYIALVASCLVMFGSIVTLYFRRERVWAKFDEEGGRAQVLCTDEEIYEKISSR